MTVIVSTIWGGRISIIADRRISRRMQGRGIEVVDDDSNKLIVVQCYGALFAIAYTGVATAHESWMDCVIAERLAHRTLKPALVEPGAPMLARPAFALINELRINLNGALNSDRQSRLERLEVLVQGWDFRGKRLLPFSCKLVRGAAQPNGYRYFELKHHAVAKFFRENPTGLWGETLGDDGGSIPTALEALRSSVGFTHDDFERHLREAVLSRSRETHTVSPACVALQLDPRVPDGQALVTYYPQETSPLGYPLLSPWVLTPRMICAPSISTSAYSPRSECGRYLLGGFSDGNTHLHVRTRLPVEYGMPSGEGPLRFEFQPRAITP